MNKFVLRQTLLLLLAALIWGVAFVAQSVGMEYVGPFTFNAVRSLLGGVTLLPVIAAARRKTKRAESNGSFAAKENASDVLHAPAAGQSGQLLAAGMICGVLLCVATNLQQIGIQYTTVGKSGFITAMYIVIVPLIGLLIGRRAGIRVWAAVAFAVVGLYFLCMFGGDVTFERGDLLMLLCAVAFSFHITVVDYFAPRVDGVKLSCIQFFVSGVLSGIGMLLFESPQMSQILAAWLPIVYAGVLSCGVAYTLQIVGQRGMNPTVASLLLSMEAVISVIAGFVLLHQKLSPPELFGCALMLLAIVLVQLPGKQKSEGGR